MSVEDLRTALADYEDWLKFTEEGDYIVVTPKSYNNSKWQKVNPQIKELGGEWKSLGKMSHWKVPKGKRENALKKREFDKDLDVYEIAHACLDKGDATGYVLVLLQQIRDELRKKELK